MSWDTEEEYDIINAMKVFMGENEGRKLFFDTFISRKYAMQSEHSIFEDFSTFLKKEKSRWNGKKPLLLVITYENHYTGIRVDTDKTVTLFDPNYTNSLYSPISKKMRETIANVFETVPIDYKYTCQITHDEADSFCQTWSLYLLTHPNFTPPTDIRARFAIILESYKKILRTKRGKNIYKKFLKDIGHSKKEIQKYMGIVKMSLDTFVAAMYATQKEYENRGFQLQLKF